MRSQKIAASAVVLIIVSTVFVAPAWAVPEFSRSTGSDCVECHVSPPMLNERGESFEARGYRLPEHLDHRSSGTIPFSVWTTSRTQTHGDLDGSDTFITRVEPIIGGSIGDLPISYFVEWRLLDLHVQSDGSRGDRSGRFEDVEVAIEFIENHTVEVGQYRALTQLNASQRLSVSEPSIMGAGLPGRSDERARRESVRSFSPSGRSPSVRYEWHSIEEDESIANGLFHALSVVFPGEFSLPITDRASEAASFEFEPRPKGVFGETYYRRGLSSAGVHAFAGDAGRWLAQALGRINYDDFLVTAGLGRDSGTGEGARTRMSIQPEYLIRWHPRVRGALGLRAENITNEGQDPAYIPYLSVAGPNTRFSAVLQAEYRIQEDREEFFIDISTMF